MHQKDCVKVPEHSCIVAEILVGFCDIDPGHLAFWLSLNIHHLTFVCWCGGQNALTHERQSVQSAQASWAVEPQLLIMSFTGSGGEAILQTDTLRDVLAQAMGRRGKAEEAGC